MPGKRAPGAGLARGVPRASSRSGSGIIL